MAQPWAASLSNRVNYRGPTASSPKWSKRRAAIMACAFMRPSGISALSPFNGFLLLQGLETLHVRMERHCSNALAVAQFLESHKSVSWVNYPGLTSSKYHALARKYLPKGASAIMTFGIKGGQAAGVKFIDAAQFMSHL